MVIAEKAEILELNRLGFQSNFALKDPEQVLSEPVSSSIKWV